MLLRAVTHERSRMQMNCKSCNPQTLCYISTLKMSECADKNASETKAGGWQQFYSICHIQLLPVSICTAQKHRNRNKRISDTQTLVYLWLRWKWLTERCKNQEDALYWITVRCNKHLTGHSEWMALHLYCPLMTISTMLILSHPFLSWQRSYATVNLTSSQTSSLSGTSEEVLQPEMSISLKSEVQLPGNIVPVLKPSTHCDTQI